jgi:hypothetical protein
MSHHMRLFEEIVVSFGRLLFLADKDLCDCDCSVWDRDLSRGEGACDWDTGVGDFVRVETWLSRDVNPRVPWSNLVVSLHMRWGALDGDRLSGSTVLCRRFETRVWELILG